LHPSCRQAGLDALPQHRRRLVADQAVQDAPRLLRVDLALIDVEGVGQRFGDRVLGDLVEQHPPDIPISIQLGGHMPGYRFTFSIRIRRE